MTDALLEVPSRAAEVLEHDEAIQRDRAARRAGARRAVPRAAATASRSRWKAR